MHGRSPPLGSQEGHRSFLLIEAKLGGLITAGQLAAQAAEANLETAEAEQEKVKPRAGASLCRAHSRTWVTGAGHHLD